MKKALLYSLFFLSSLVFVLLDKSFDGGGTGVLISNGKILTAKHVVDVNRNGRIDFGERDVRLKFYYPEEFSLTGRVVYAPPGKLRVAKGYDFVVIQPETSMKSNIRLVSLEDHILTGAGKKIYTIGRSNGETLHITFGNQSTDAEGFAMYDRTTLNIWFGNSGGPVFTEDDGQLLGIIIIKRDAGPFGPQLWSGYMGATSIRLHLMEHNAEHYIQTIEDTKAYQLQTFLLVSLILLNCHLGVYFGLPVLCKRVWHMQRANADV